MCLLFLRPLHCNLLQLSAFVPLFLGLLSVFFLFHGAFLITRCNTIIWNSARVERLAEQYQELRRLAALYNCKNICTILVCFVPLNLYIFLFLSILANSIIPDFKDELAREEVHEIAFVYLIFQSLSFFCKFFVHIHHGTGAFQIIGESFLFFQKSC